MGLELNFLYISSEGGEAGFNISLESTNCYIWFNLNKYKVMYSRLEKKTITQILTNFAVEGMKNNILFQHPLSCISHLYCSQVQDRAQLGPVEAALLLYRTTVIWACSLIAHISQFLVYDGCIRPLLQILSILKLVRHQYPCFGYIPTY